MKMTMEEENSNFDAAHWQAKPAEYEHFHGHWCPQKNEIDNYKDTPNFLVQDPVVQIKDKKGNSHRSHDEETGHKQSATADLNRCIPRRCLNKPWDTQTQKNIKCVTSHGVWHRHVAVTWERTTTTKNQNFRTGESSTMEVKGKRGELCPSPPPCNPPRGSQLTDEPLLQSQL